MAFQLRVPNEYASTGFNKYLLQMLVDRSLDTLNGNYGVLDKELQEFLGVRDRTYTCRSLLSYYIRTFSIVPKSDYVSIGDNKSEKVADSDKKFSDVARFIEYGHIGVSPVPRISSAINEMQSNLDEIYKHWKGNK